MVDQQTYLGGSYLKDQLKWPPRVRNERHFHGAVLRAAHLLFAPICNSVLFFVSQVYHHALVTCRHVHGLSRPKVRKAPSSE